jgi:hypothetical protein
MKSGWWSMNSSITISSIMDENEMLVDEFHPLDEN